MGTFYICYLKHRVLRMTAKRGWDEMRMEKIEAKYLALCSRRLTLYSLYTALSNYHAYFWDQLE